MPKKQPARERVAERREREAEALAKPLGPFVGNVAKGAVFEDWLRVNLGGHGNFKSGGREFDGAYGNTWYEAKSGDALKSVVSDPVKLGKFQSDLISHQTEAQRRGKTFELHVNRPVPTELRPWLAEKTVKVIEH